MIKPVDDGDDTTTDAGTREYPIKEYYDTIVPLLRSIDDTNSPACSLKRKMAVRRKFIIEYVTAFENMFKEYATWILTANIPDLLEKGDKDTYKFGRIDEMYGEKISSLAFLAWLESYQDLNAIDRCLTAFLNTRKPFLQEVERFTFSCSAEMQRFYEERLGLEFKNGCFTLTTALPDWKKHVDKLFQVRLQYLRRSKVPRRIGILKLREMYRCADALVFAAHHYIRECMRDFITES